MAGDFDLLVRGSIILEWSPSGALTRYVVSQPNARAKSSVLGGESWIIGHDVVELNDDNSVTVGSHTITPTYIETAEGFGGTFVFLVGERYPLPDFVP